MKRNKSNTTIVPVAVSRLGGIGPSNYIQDNTPTQKIKGVGEVAFITIRARGYQAATEAHLLPLGQNRTHLAIKKAEKVEG